MKSKSIALQSAAYKLLLQSFTQWLQLLNYSPLSIPGIGSSIRDFLLYQQSRRKLSLSQLIATDANDFIEHLQTKLGERTKQALSSSHINKNIQSLKLFSKYIRETGRSGVGFNLLRLEQRNLEPVWLTKAEVQLLYDVIKDNVLGIRDRAMLAVYYGCGLRLNEGASLEVRDIDAARKVLHVRKGKHYKERYVPIAEKNYEEIKLYVDYGRVQLMQDRKHDYLFVDANKGKGMHKQSLYIRIKQLVKKAGIEKKVGTHSLRHSIATHLLQSGMKLERIQQFLGHSHLDSTQIYTHLTNESI